MRTSLCTVKKSENNKLSFADTLASNFINSKDPIYLNQFAKFQMALEGNFMSYYQSNFDKIVSNQDPNRWIRGSKYDSTVCAKIYLSKVFLNYIDLRTDLALRITAALVHCPYNDKNLFFKLPTKYLCIRASVSEKKIYSLIQLLEALALVEVKQDRDQVLYIKLSKELINDSWVEEVFHFTEYSNLKAYLKAVDTGSIYNNGISRKAINANIRQDIINITLAFNHLIDTDPVLRKQYAINGTRTDIIYAHCPVDLICYITGKSENIIREELNKLCTKTEIVSKHDKVYINNGEDHYVDQSYQYTARLMSVEGNTLEEGHPIIDKNSIIWHTEKLYRSKYYKRFSKKKDRIISRIDKALVLFSIRNKIQLSVNWYNADSSKYGKFTNNDIKKCSELFKTTNGAQSISILSKENLENMNKHGQIPPYLLKDNLIKKLSVPKLIYVYKRTMYCLVNSGMKAYRRLLHQRDLLLDIIPDRIYQYSKEVNYNQAVKWKDQVENLVNVSDRNLDNNSIRYDFIQVDLYEKYADRILNPMKEAMIYDTTPIQENISDDVININEVQFEEFEWGAGGLI